MTLARSDLARLIYDRIASRCETIFGDGITGLEPSGDGVQVTFERAAPRRFDLVVGADGLHSAVRKLAFGDDGRFEAYLAGS